jgi:hypothetical protein
LHRARAHENQENLARNLAREPHNKDKDKDHKEKFEREMECLDEGLRALCSEMDSDPCTL